MNMWPISSQLSAWHFDEQDEFDGGDVIVRQGYRMIGDFLVQNLDIRLNHVVQRVTYDDSGVTIIEAIQGAWHAQGALIPVPLGV